MLTDRPDGWTDNQTDDGQKVIVITHPEHSSGELKRRMGQMRTRHVSKVHKCPCSLPIWQQHLAV